MRLTLVTVGDPRRRTGGYRYHARLLSRLAGGGVDVRQVVAGTAEPDLGDPDVVVVDALARRACGAWIGGWRAERPVVALVHELPSVAEPGLADPADEEPLLAADLLVAVSGWVAGTLTARGVAPDRIRVVPPGYDDHRAAAPAPHDGVRVLCVAQWIRRKGIAELLRAWTAGDRAGARLVLVGETGADPAYAAEVRALTADTVEVRGPVDDAVLTRCYAEADLFALPSAAEGYGIVYAEALACGLPVLACATGPVPDLVGDAGILVPPGDHTALVAALDRLLGDAALRARLAALARRRARALPSWDDCAARFLAVLEEVAS